MYGTPTDERRSIMIDKQAVAGMIVVAGLVIGLGAGVRSAAGDESIGTLTVQAGKVDADLTDFPVYVDLADMGNGFWDNVTVGFGQTDVVVKNAGSEVLSREIVSIDTSVKTGEMHFKADLLSGTSDTTFTITVGGGTLAGSDTDTWSNGYLGVWHLGEAAGSHSDSTATGHDGLRNGNTYDADGKLHGAQSLDGDNDYIELSSFDIAGGSLLTVSAWVKLAELPSDGQHATLWGNYLTDDDRSLLNVSAADHKLTAFAEVGSNTVIDDVKSEPALTASTWQYAAVSLNATTATAEVCLDGAFTSGAYSSAIQADNHVIGAMKSNHRFDGLVDEFRMSSVARSADWLATVYNNQGSPDTFYSVIPEPGTLGLLATGAVALLLRRTGNAGRRKIVRA